MTDHVDPAVARRRVRMELRRARAAAGYSQKRAADDLGWSVSKVLRIESGQVGVSRLDLLALLSLYGVVDPEIQAEYENLARASAIRADAWSDYVDVFNPEFRQYLRFEGLASGFQQFELIYIPGILQTREYAAATIQAVAKPGTPPERIDRQVEARLARQAILNRPQPPTMRFILDEAVIRRWDAGEPTIMRNQLEWLKQLNRRPQVDIQILPFRSGPHLGLRGAFVVLEFPDGDDEILYLENRSGSVLVRDDLVEVAQYQEFFIKIEELATPASELDQVIDRVLQDMDQKGT